MNHFDVDSTAVTDPQSATREADLSRGGGLGRPLGSRTLPSAHPDRQPLLTESVNKADERRRR